MSRRWRYPRSRRGVFYGPLQPPAVSSAPSYVPAFQEPSGRNARLAGMRSRRGRFFTVTRIVCPPPRQPKRYGVRLASVRHGKFFSVPLVAVVASPPPWVPAPMDPARRAPMRPTRRGRFYAVPLVGLAPLPPAWVPSPLDPARRAIARTTRRGKFYTVPPIGVAPSAAPWVPPSLDPARRQPARATRRGEFFAIPLIGASPPQVIATPRLSSRRPRPPFNRRGHFWTAPLQQIVSAPSWVPPMTRARRAPARPTRHGEYLLVPTVRVPCQGRITSRRPRLIPLARGRMFWSTPPAGAPAPTGRDLTLVGVLEANHWIAVLEANRLTADVESNHWTADLEADRWVTDIEPNRWEGTVPWPEL